MKVRDSKCMVISYLTLRVEFHCSEILPLNFGTLHVFLGTSDWYRGRCRPVVSYRSSMTPKEVVFGSREEQLNQYISKVGTNIDCARY